jgi:tetratricopeptide (TPR) repeat protein
MFNKNSARGAAMADNTFKMVESSSFVSRARPELLRAVATLALAAALTGCATTRTAVQTGKPNSSAAAATEGAVAAVDGSSSSGPTSLNPSNSVDSKRVAEEGLKYLREGDSEKAVRLFNAALKFDSENGTYHLLAGFAYHLEFRKTSTPEMRDNAEIGYKLAAKFNPGDIRATVQLGRLFLDSKRAADARDAFATALESNPANTDALHGMATASYLLGDIKVALWAVSELELQKYDPAVIARMRAVFYTAVGDKEKAAQYSAAYASSAVGQNDTGSFDERLSQIKAMVDNEGWLKAPDATTPGQSPASDAGAAASASQDAPGAAPVVVPPATEAVVEKLPTQPWWDCPGGPPSGMQFGSQGGGSNSGDETVQLPALPAPCPYGKAPKMAIIDVVMLRTEDAVSRSYGSNLLQNLTGYFGWSASFNGSTRPAGNFIGRGSTGALLGLGGAMGAGSALGYSLNIANATQNRNEVLARPSLLAIDRLPSTFFSGANISISVGGGTPGANSMLVDKQVGVSFSVTPTFIDDDHVLLTVKTARSFVTAPAVGTTGVALSQSRLATSANLMVSPGQTVILSGLAERERVRGKAGVPVLRDIPGVQYFFANDQNLDYFRTVMVMLTMRKPVVSAEDIAGVEAEKLARKITGVPQIKKYGFYWRVDEYAKTLSRSAPNMDAAIDALFSNKLYQTFKSSDLDDKDWASVGRIQSIRNDLKGIFIH